MGLYKYNSIGLYNSKLVYVVFIYIIARYLRGNFMDKSNLNRFNWSHFMPSAYKLKPIN